MQVDQEASTANLALVLPPQKGLLEGFSSGLVSLANYIELHEPSFDVRPLDLSLCNPESVQREIAAHLLTMAQPLIVGITTTTASYQSALTVARACKQARPDCVVVLGGHHASAQDDVILRTHEDSIDVVIRGEGEIPLIELLRRHPHLGEVPSASFLAEGRLVRTPSAPLLDSPDLDRLPPTFREMSFESAPGKFDHATYVSARGCPLRCSFCSVANQAIRAKSIPAVIEDIRFLVERIGARRIAIEDNFFAHNPRRTIELCTALEKLRQELPFTWDCQSRVESMSNETVVTAMNDAGCEAVYLGVEALHPEHLRYLGKTRNPDWYLETLENRVVPRLLVSDIDCYINLQFALPRHLPDHDEIGFDILKRLGLTAFSMGREITIYPQLHVVYPGTAHFESAMEEKRFGRESHAVFEHFTEWESRSEPILTWLGEHFAHGVGGIPEGLLVQSEMKDGRFEIDPDRVLAVSNALTHLSDLPGIQVFRYGRYLTGTAERIRASGVLL